MKAVQGIFYSYSYLHSGLFKNFSDIGYVILFRFRVHEQTEYGQHQDSFYFQNLLSNFEGRRLENCNRLLRFPL